MSRGELSSFPGGDHEFLRGRGTFFCLPQWNPIWRCYEYWKFFLRYLVYLPNWIFYGDNDKHPLDLGVAYFQTNPDDPDEPIFTMTPWRHGRVEPRLVRHVQSVDWLVREDLGSKCCEWWHLLDRCWVLVSEALGCKQNTKGWLILWLIHIQMKIS